MQARQLHQQKYGKQRNGYSSKHQAFIQDQTSALPYDIEDQVSVSHHQYYNESATHYPYPPYTQQNRPYNPYYPQRKSQRKLPRHERSYTATLEEALHQQTVLNIEQIIFQNTQIIENLTKDNERLLTHLENIKQIFELKRSYNSQSNSHQTPIKLEPQNLAKNQNGRTSTKRQYSETVNVKTTEEIRSELKKKIKVEKVPVNKASKPSSNQAESQKQAENNPYKGSINYITETWAIQQNYVMRFLHLWLKDNIQKVDNEDLAIDKKIIMGCYENWRNLQKFEIESHLKTAQVQQILTNEVKAFFKCSCNAKGFVGLEFTKEEFKRLGSEEKQEESEIESLEIEEEKKKKAE